MRTISKTKDYFDFVGKVYRDEDPRAKVWIRTFEEVDLKRFEPKGSKFGVGPLFLTPPVSSDKRDWHRCEITVCDRTYGLIYKAKPIGEGVYADDFAKRIAGMHTFSSQGGFEKAEWERNNRHRWWHGENTKDDWKFYNGTPRPALQLMRKVQMEHKSPIILAWNDNLYVNPNLQSFGLQHWIDPYQLYQEVATWFSDGKFDSDPPDNQTDKDKILAHGLDLKTSFRHPIK